MKKLFFTAIAFVAFSGASMANTIADEEIVNNEKISVVEIKAPIEKANTENQIDDDLWLCIPVKRTTDTLSDGTVMIEVIYKCYFFL